MLRRSFLAAVSAVSAYPLIPDQYQPKRRPSVPTVGSIMFWFHFYSAVERGSMSTEWAREKAVEEMNLQDLTEDEAKEFLELASEGAYDRGDIPEQWCNIFDQQKR